MNLAADAMPAHDMPPLVPDADVNARYDSAFAKMSTPKPGNTDLLDAIDYVVDYEVQSMKAAVRCGGKFLSSRVRRVVCLSIIRDKIVEALAKEQG